MISAAPPIAPIIICAAVVKKKLKVADYQADNCPDFGDCNCGFDPCRCPDLDEERRERAEQHKIDDAMERDLFE
jgi:hypothetical protein